MICKNCGNEIRDGDRFCTRCGAVVSADEPVVEATPQSTAAAYMPAPAVHPAPAKPTNAGKGLRVVACILAPHALAVMLLYCVLRTISLVEEFSYNGYYSYYSKPDYTDLMMPIIYMIMVLVSVILLLVVATKRDYRTGRAAVPLTLSAGYR